MRLHNPRKCSMIQEYVGRMGPTARKLILSAHDDTRYDDMRRRKRYTSGICSMLHAPICYKTCWHLFLPMIQSYNHNKRICWHNVGPSRRLILSAHASDHLPKLLQCLTMYKIMQCHNIINQPNKTK